MSVDVSGKRFTVPREITASGNFLTVKFYVKDMPIPRSLYDRISWFSGTPNQLKYYREGDNTGVVLYNAGEWVSDAYYDIFSKITFATGTTLTDSEYEWLTSFAVEETLYLAEGDSLGQVANAIRDRSWAVGMYNFPDGFDAAIRAIGNYYTGGTVAWNQLSNPADYTESVGGIVFIIANGRYKASGLASSTFNRTIENLTIISGHIYLMAASGQTYPVSAAATASMQLYGAGIIAITNPENSLVDSCIGQATGSGSAVLRMRFATGNNYDYDFYPQVFDLSAIFGDTIAQYLLLLDTDTAGAGAAKFRELFPDLYYAHQDPSVLTSFKPGDWPMNAGTELRGIITLEDGKWGRFYSDESNKGVVYRRNNVMPFIPTGVNWEYMSGDYFRWSSPSGLRFFPYSSIPTSNGTIITDAYPFGGNIDLSQQDPVQDPTILKDGYIMQGYSSSGFVLYVKDSTITSDHLNEFKTKNAAKTLIGVSTFTYE